MSEQSYFIRIYCQVYHQFQGRRFLNVSVSFYCLETFYIFSVIESMRSVKENMYFPQLQLQKQFHDICTIFPAFPKNLKMYLQDKI